MKESGAKKIAVLVRKRQGEALRMAVGLTLADNLVDVYFLGRGPDGSDEAARGIEVLSAVEAGIFSVGLDAEGMAGIDAGEFARRLTGYDQVLPY